MKPRPSIQTAFNIDGIRYSPSKNGEFTNRSLAKSVYSGFAGFHTTKNRDIKLNMDNTARRSVIEFPKNPNETPNGTSQKQIPFFGGSKFTSSYSNWNFK